MTSYDWNEFHVGSQLPAFVRNGTVYETISYEADDSLASVQIDIGTNGRVLCTIGFGIEESTVGETIVGTLWQRSITGVAEAERLMRCLDGALRKAREFLDEQRADELESTPDA